MIISKVFQETEHGYRKDTVNWNRISGMLSKAIFIYETQRCIKKPEDNIVVISFARKHPVQEDYRVVPTELY